MEEAASGGNSTKTLDPKESKKPSSKSAPYFQKRKNITKIYKIMSPSLTILSLSDSAFKQQRLPAWQPILTAGTVLPTFFVIGILFIPVGIGLCFFSDNVREITIPYTHCLSIKDKETNRRTCANVIRNNSDVLCQCEVHFALDTQFTVSFLQSNAVSVFNHFLKFRMLCT